MPWNIKGFKHFLIIIIIIILIIIIIFLLALGYTVRQTSLSTCIVKMM